MTAPVIISINVQEPPNEVHEHKPFVIKLIIIEIEQTRKLLIPPPSGLSSLPVSP